MSATHVSASLRRLVRERAGECCEYCLIPEASMSHRLIETVETVVAAPRLTMLESRILRTESLEFLDDIVSGVFAC